MTQDSRQALIELLFLALYLDDHLSLAEDEVLSNALDSIGWDGPQSRESFILSAFSKAREASNCALKTEAFMESRSEIIRNSGESGFALTWLVKILAADGISGEEERFLKQLESRLFV